MTTAAASSTTDVTHRLPNLLLAGVKKAGTTSLIEYLGQHPDIARGTVKAVNYFKGDEPGVPAMALEEYAAHWQDAGAEPWRVESPTTYFYFGRPMAEAVDATLPDVRVVVSLRDPVTRLWSDFRMKRREDPARLGDLTFEEYVGRSEAAHRDGDLEAHPGFASFARGMYADMAGDWYDVLGDRFRIVFVEQWSRDPAALVEDLCRWLDLPTAPVAEISFPVRNADHDFRSRRLARVARQAYRAATTVAPALTRVKPTLVDVHRRVNGAGRGEERMSPEMRDHLREAYADSNARLAQLLRDHGHESLPGWLRTVS